MTAVDGAEDSTVELLTLLIEGTDSMPRIKKASVDMLKSVKARIEESAGKENGPEHFNKLLSKACGEDTIDGEKVKKVKASFETKKAAPKRGNLRAFMKARVQ